MELPYTDVDVSVPFPIEVVIGQTPLSVGASTKSKNDWKEAVAQQTRDAISRRRDFHFLDGRPLMVTIYYFPPVPMEGDIDNIVKLILDGMNTVVYPNDRHIERVVVQKFEPGIGWVFPSVSETLATAIDMDKPSLYIRVDDHLGWRQAP